jgi:hypothetical protein
MSPPAAVQVQPPAALPPIARVARGGPLPATFYQQWGWESLNGRASHDFNLAFAVRFACVLSLPALAASLRELERRQEALRTFLVPAADEPWTVCQVIHSPGSLEIPLIDLSLLSPEQREGELGRLALEEAVRPLDVARPMVRVRLVRLAGTDHVLLFTLGHLVCDGWSIEILRGELAALYEAFAAGRPSPLPELSVQLADFAAWQHGIERSEAMAAQLAYWRKRLAGLPRPLVLSGDWRPERHGGTEQAACCVSVADTARLRRLARAEECSPPMVILTAFGMLLAVYTGETDLVIEGKVLGRMQPELGPVVGLFMSSLPHRLDLSSRSGFAEALRRTRDGVLADYERQDVTYPQLLRSLFPGRRYLSRIGLNVRISPRPASFEIRDREEEIFSSNGRWPDVAQAKYDLLLDVHDDGERIRLMLLAAAPRFHRETVAEMVVDLEALLLGALAVPSAPARRLLPAPRFRHARRAPSQVVVSSFELP